MNFLPYRSQRGPPMAAPAAAPNALALSEASSPTARSSSPKLSCQRLRLVAIAMIEIGRAQSELQSRENLVCRLLLEKKKTINIINFNIYKINIFRLLILI